MYQVGRVPDHVHRSYKEHNRWMYVAPVRKSFSLWSLLEWVGIGFAVGAIMIAVCLVLVMPLIG